MSIAHENQVYRYAEAKRRREMAQEPVQEAPKTCDNEHDVKHDASFMLFPESVRQEREEQGIYRQE